MSVLNHEINKTRQWNSLKFPNVHIMYEFYLYSASDLKQTPTQSPISHFSNVYF